MEISIINVGNKYKIMEIGYEVIIIFKIVFSFVVFMFEVILKFVFIFEIYPYIEVNIGRLNI